MRIRITFSKQGALRYTGNLDLHRLWERAARRAQLPLAYSQGFHPQPKMSLAAALPLGFSSRCEVLDMRMERDIPLEGLRGALQDTLPEGIRVLSVEQVEERAPALQTQVVSAEYEVELREAVDGSALKRKVDSIMESESILRTRRSKTYDLRPLIEELVLIPSPLHPSPRGGDGGEGDGPGEKIHMKLSAREGATGRPEEVLDVLGIPHEETRIERTRLNFLEIASRSSQ
jgi:radical SAM-linked protein